MQLAKISKLTFNYCNTFKLAQFAKYLQFWKNIASILVTLANTVQQVAIP
jgi:hypothetical protein